MLGICTKCGRTEEGYTEEERNDPKFLCLKCWCPSRKGEHYFISCDEHPATCVCGKQEYENGKN